MRLQRMIPVVLAVLVLAGCRAGEEAAPPPRTVSPLSSPLSSPSPAPTPSPTGSQTAAPVVPAPTLETARPVPDTTGVGTADAALAFFRATEAECADFVADFGATPPEPARFAGATVGEQVGEGVWRITDGAGDDLHVDLGTRTVYSTDGPDGILPPVYSFGCPEDLYLGTLPS